MEEDASIPASELLSWSLYARESMMVEYGDNSGTLELFEPSFLNVQMLRYAVQIFQDVCVLLTSWRIPPRG